jgi:antitoxin (DNA-binding transcriptional repressor) of toxin-antitoxin stability system
MRTVGLKVLKNRLSEYVRLAASGETVLVTDRDRVVAELTPPRTDLRSLPDDLWIAEAARRGWLTPAKNRTGKAPPGRAPVCSFEELMDDLAKDREDR